MDPASRTGSEVRRGVNSVVAVVLAIVAWPALAARALGGQPPDPGPRLAALAPVAVAPAVAAVAIAATVRWWLAALLAVPAAILVAWQWPPQRRPGRRPGRRGPRDAAPDVLTLRVLSLNVLGDSADPAAVLSRLRQHQVDVLAIQELTPDMVRTLTDAGLAGLLPFAHLDPRPGSPGVGLWARWPLIPLPPVPGLAAAAPRARIEPAGGWPVVLSAVHPIAPTSGSDGAWQRDLVLLRAALVRSALDGSALDGSALDGTGGRQVVAGDFNASRDHRLFRDLLAAGFLDCADAALRRPWPGFTWPADRLIPPLMRLDHVLVSRAGATVLEARTVRVPGTDHRGVLAVIEFRRLA